MPIPNPPTWAATEKNKLEHLSGWIQLFELEYDPGLFLRLARWSQNVSWNSQSWTAWPIGEINTSNNIQGELPTTNIPIVDLTDTIMAFLENYVLEGKKGNLYLVHEAHLGDVVPVRRQPFTVVRVDCTWEIAQFQVILAQAAFEPLQRQLPSKLVTRDEFPGVIGSRIVV